MLVDAERNWVGTHSLGRKHGLGNLCAWRTDSGCSKVRGTRHVLSQKPCNEADDRRDVLCVLTSSVVNSIYGHKAFAPTTAHNLQIKPSTHITMSDTMVYIGPLHAPTMHCSPPPQRRRTRGHLRYAEDTHTDAIACKQFGDNAIVWRLCKRASHGSKRDVQRRSHEHDLITECSEQSIKLCITKTH